MARSKGGSVARTVVTGCLTLVIAACSGESPGGGGGGPEQTLPASYPGAKIIFVTHTRDDGNLLAWMPQCSGRSTGLEAADCICQEHARIWGALSGTYKAWLSDSSHGAASRLSHSTVPYVNRRGEVIAADWAGLASAPCSDLTRYDESGDLMEGDLVWTGSDSSGNAMSPAKTCDDWTSGASSRGGWVGRTGVDGYWPNFPGCWSEWVDGGGWRDCDDWNFLYCVEQ